MTNELSTTRDTLEQKLRGLLATIESVDLAAPDAAAMSLSERHPPESGEVQTVRELLETCLREGGLQLSELHTGVQQGCVVEKLGDYGVTALLIEGKGRGHTHPEGEVGLGFAWSGEPVCDGRGPGWVVHPPGSHHRPMVTGGQMLFLFFRPHGQVVWDSLGDPPIE